MREEEKLDAEWKVQQAGCFDIRFDIMPSAKKGPYVLYSKLVNCLLLFVGFFAFFMRFADWQGREQQQLELTAFYMIAAAGEAEADGYAAEDHQRKDGKAKSNGGHFIEKLPAL